MPLNRLLEAESKRNGAGLILRRRVRRQRVEAPRTQRPLDGLLQRWARFQDRPRTDDPAMRIHCDLVADVRVYLVGILREGTVQQTAVESLDAERRGALLVRAVP